MQDVQLNFNAASIAPAKALDPLPSGWYNATITASEMKPTRTPGGQMLALELTILDGVHAGRKLFDNLNIVNANPVAVQIAYEQLSAICHAVNVIKCDVASQLHNKPLKVKVKYKAASVGDDGKNYEAGNDVKGYDSINSSHEVSGAAVVPGVAGAPAGLPAWATASAPVAEAAAAPTPAYTPPGPAFVAPPAPNFVPPAATPAAPPPPVAHVPAPVPPPPSGPVMLPAAGAASYESYIAQGWTDELLIQHGMMAAPAASAPKAAERPAPWAVPR